MSLVLEKVDGDTSIQDDLTRIRNENYEAIENAVNAKAESADVYTQTQIDNALANKQDKAITIDEQATTVEGAIQDNTTNVATALSRQDVVLGNEVVNGDTETSFTSDNSGTGIVSRENGTWTFHSTYSTAYPTFNLNSGEKWFIYCKLKDDSVGLLKDAIYIRYSDSSSSTVSFSSDNNKLLVYGTFTPTKALLANIVLVEGDSGLIERDYQMLLNKTQLGLTDIPDETIVSMIENIGYFEGAHTVTNRELLDIINDKADINGTALLDTVPTFNGIKFPSTQIASSDVNTLDDYEEGTWTPLLYGSSVVGSPTYLKQNGKYTKIGSTIVINGQIEITSKNDIDGALFIGGLPFFAGNYGAGSVARIKGVDLLYNITIRPISGVLGIYYQASKTAHGQILSSSINDSTYFDFSMVITN